MNKKMKKEIKIRPRAGWILVKEDEPDTKVGQVYLPSTTEQEKKSQGIVLEVGAGIDDLKKGDVCVFGTFAGEPILLPNDKAKYRLLLDEDVIAIIG